MRCAHPVPGQRQLPILGRAARVEGACARRGTRVSALQLQALLRDAVPGSPSADSRGPDVLASFPSHCLRR